MLTAKDFTGGALRDVISPRVTTGRYPDVVLGPHSWNFPTARTTNVASGAAASGAWPAANVPIGCEFWLDEPFTIYQLGWANGSGTMTDAVDVGVYDSSGNRQIAAASTNANALITRSGVSAFQWANVADTVIGPGRWRLVMTSNGTTANNHFGWGGPGAVSATAYGMCGILEASALSAGAILPSSLTLAAGSTSATTLPLMMIAGRATV